MDGVARVATGTGFLPCWKAAAPARRGRYAAEDGQIHTYLTESPNVATEMVALLCFFLTLLASLFKSKSRLEAENAAL